MFGVTSAPKKYQQIIRDILPGFEGVANIADDLIIHGRGEEQHDESLGCVRSIEENRSDIEQRQMRIQITQVDICDPPYERGAYGNFQKTCLNTAFKRFSNMFETVFKHV